MIISDLSTLEVVSEEKDVFGGAFNFLTTEFNVSGIGQGSFSASSGGGNFNFLSSIGGATANSPNTAIVGQSNN